MQKEIEAIANQKAPPFIKQAQFHFKISLSSSSLSEIQLHPAAHGTFVLIDAEYIDFNKSSIAIKHINLDGETIK